MKRTLRKFLPVTKSQRVGWVIAVCLFSGSGFALIVSLMGPSTRPVNSYSLSVNVQKSTFSVTEKSSGLLVVSNSPLIQTAASVQTVAITNSTLGKGLSYEIAYTSGDKGRFMLFERLPFVLYQSSFVNPSNEVRVINTYKPFEVALNPGFNPSNMWNVSTAGRLPVSNGKGGYMFVGTADPATRKGFVCGWLTSDKGSGIVIPNYFKNVFKYKPMVEYGGLRVQAHETVDSEILAFGYFDDARIGLEQYADAVATYYDIHLPPQPGVYCTWYHAKSSDEVRIMDNARFAQTNLLDYGLSVMQIDDQWQGDSSKMSPLPPDDKFNGPYKVFTGPGPDGYFPSGMDVTASNLTAAGFTPGIWFMPFAGTYNDTSHFPVGLVDFFTRPESGEPYNQFWAGTEIDMSSPKSQAYLRETVQRIAGWGYKYFKMDGLLAGLGVQIRYPTYEYNAVDDFGLTGRYDLNVTPVEIYRNAFNIIREEAGNDVFFLGCNAAQNGRVLGASFGLVDAMRVGPDNGVGWDHWKTPGKIVGTMKAGPVTSGRVYFLNDRVWHNDPDPIYVRDVEKVPLEQARALASWVALSGQMNSSSEDYYDLPTNRLEIIQRTLPTHGCKNVRPVDYFENEPAQIWLLSDKISNIDHYIVGLYNWEASNTLHVAYSMEKIGLDPASEYCGFDFWANEFVGPFQGQLNYDVAPASCNILALRKVRAVPQVISTSRHITQGVVDLVAEQWRASTRTLSGTSRVIAGDPYEIRVVAPISFTAGTASLVGAPAGTTIQVEQNGTQVRATIRSAETTEIRWTLVF